MKSFLTVLLILFVSVNGWSQQVLEKEGYSMSIVTNQYQYFPSMGGSYIGVIKVIGSDSIQKYYGFTLIIMKDSVISHLAVKSADFSETLLPRLYYDQKTNTFLFNKGAKNEKQEVVESSSSHEMIILSGVLIWLKERNKVLISAKPKE